MNRMLQQEHLLSTQAYPVTISPFDAAVRWQLKQYFFVEYQTAEAGIQLEQDSCHGREIFVIYIRLADLVIGKIDTWR